MTACNSCLAFSRPASVCCAAAWPAAKPARRLAPSAKKAPLEPALRMAALEAMQANASDAHRVRPEGNTLRADVAEKTIGGRFDAVNAFAAGRPIRVVD